MNTVLTIYRLILVHRLSPTHTPNANEQTENITDGRAAEKDRQIRKLGATTQEMKERQRIEIK